MALIFVPRPLGPWVGIKRSNIISITKSISKILYQTLCVFSTVKGMGFSFCHLGHAPGVGLWGVGGAQGSFFFKHGHVAYIMDCDDEQNRMQVKFSSYGQTGDLWVRSKGQLSLDFGYHVNFKYFYTKLRVCSHNQKIENILNRIFILCWGHAPGVGLGGAVGQKLKRRDLRRRPIDCPF